MPGVLSLGAGGQTKTCTACRTDKPTEEFHKSKGSKDGLNGVCKPCNCAKAKAWMAKNPERAKQSRQLVYHRSKAKVIERATTWRRENRERRKEIVKTYDAAHKKQKAVYNRNRTQRARLENPERVLEEGRKAAAVRRARENRNGRTLTKDWWDGIVALFETGRCLYCGLDNQELVMDHFVPVARGGPTAVGNVLPVCAVCNGSKHDEPPEKWVVERCGIDGYEAVKGLLNLMREAWDKEQTELCAESQAVIRKAIHGIEIREV